jgi:hypothetical protein
MSLFQNQNPMSPKSFAVMPMDRLGCFENKSALDWLWNVYLARGNLTLLTSLWKAGKTARPQPGT